MLKTLNIQDQNWPLTISIGIFLWLSLLLVWLPWSPFDITHVHFLLLAAPLWLVPLGWELLNVPKWIKYLALPAGLLFSVSFVMIQGVAAAVFTLPWVLLCSSLAVMKLRDWRMMKDVKVSTLCFLAASLYLPVGALWGLADRLSYSPFGFTPAITLLTAVHFHYAGFILPLITGLALKKFSGALKPFIGWGIVLGIPLVAVGISATQFQWPVIIEIVVVTVMTFSGTAVGILHIGLSRKSEYFLSKCLLLLAGLALTLGMCLAFCYGWRSVFSLPFLTVPWMYAVHGTLNAVGFAIPGLLVWYLDSK